MLENSNRILEKGRRKSRRNHKGDNSWLQTGNVGEFVAKKELKLLDGRNSNSLEIDIVVSNRKRDCMNGELMMKPLNL